MSVMKENNSIIDEQEQHEPNSQYHPAFCDAMTLILDHDTVSYTYEREYNLNSMPNRIDLLVIKNKDDEESSYGLGKLFRRYNLFEYKSPGQSLGDNEYHTAMAYAHLYCGYGKDVKYEDITISFVRDGKPYKLMSQLEEQGFTISEVEAGIYHVRKTGHIDMQIVVTRSVCDQQYIWLKALSDKITKQDVKKMSDYAIVEHEPQRRIMIEAVLNFVLQLNRDKKWIKEDMNFMGALRDLFKEEFEERDNKIAELNEKLQSKDEQLQSKNREIEELKRQLREQMNKIAVL